MRRAIAPDISTFPADDAQLIGGHCAACEATVFPNQDHCPNCSKGEMSEVLLPRTGTLVAWTTQGFLPGYPYKGEETQDSFRSFGMGLVQLDDVVRVEGRLTEGDPEKLDFGMPVELRIVPFYVDEQGDEIMTFAFAPVAAGATPSS